MKCAVRLASIRAPGLPIMMCIGSAHHPIIVRVGWADDTPTTRYWDPGLLRYGLLFALLFSTSHNSSNLYVFLLCSFHNFDEVLVNLWFVSGKYIELQTLLLHYCPTHTLKGELYILRSRPFLSFFAGRHSCRRRSLEDGYSYFYRNQKLV